METWLPVVGFEGLYEVSDAGRVRSLDRVVGYLNRHGGTSSLFCRGRVLKTPANTHGYPHVKLCRGKENTYHEPVHSIVMRAFRGEPPSGTEVCHSDGDRGNPALSNLRYGTRAENHADKLRHGTLPQGERCPSAKLTRGEVVEIRTACDTYRELASQYGVSHAAIGYIKRRKNWKHV